MTIGTNVGWRWKSLRGRLYGCALLAASLLSGTSAYAVSDNVKSACRNDYFQHCSQYMVGSEDLRQCMRRVGEDLSTPCLVALVQAGEITKEDVERRNAAKSAPVKKNDSAVAADAPGASQATTASPKKKHTKKSTKATAAGQKATQKTGQQAGTKAKAKSIKSSKSAKPTKPSVKKKGKKSKAAKSTATGAETGKTATPGKKSAATKTKKKAGTKKKSAGTAVKAEKTSKKKSAKKQATKPIDAGAP